MIQINRLFINTTWFCNMDCPRCYIPQDLRSDSASKLDTEYLIKILRYSGIDQSHKTVVMYMGGEPSVIGKKALKRYIKTVKSVLPKVRHTIVTNLFHLPNWLIELSINEFGGQIETTYANGKKQTLSGNEKRYQERFIKNLTTIIEAGVNCTVNVELNLETINAGVEAIIDVMKRTGANDWAFDFSIKFDEFNNNPVYDRFNHPILKSSTTLKEYWGFVNAIKQNKWVANKVRIASRQEGFNVFSKTGITINPNNTVTTNPLFSTMKALQYPNIESLNRSNLNLINQHQRRSVLRMTSCCSSCIEFDDCKGFSAHIPIQQDNLCAGGLTI